MTKSTFEINETTTKRELEVTPIWSMSVKGLLPECSLGLFLFNLRAFYDAGEGELRPGKQRIAFRVGLPLDLLNAFNVLLTEGVS